MTSQTINSYNDILPNTSRSKGNQAMKFGQLIKFTVRNIFLQRHAKNEAERLVPDLSLLLKKVLYEVKASVYSTLILIYFGRPRLEHTVKRNLGLGLASPPHFVYDFSKKMFLTLYFMLLLLMLLLLEILFTS